MSAGAGSASSAQDLIPVKDAHDLMRLLRDNPELIIAARWTADIQADFRRGRSFAGWALTPQPTADAAWRDYLEQACGSLLNYEDEEAYARSLARVRERLERQGYEPLQTQDGRWLMAGPGLCAYVAETAEDALWAGIAAGPLFRGTGARCRLYLFAAQEIATDPEGTPGVAFVRPVSTALDTGLTAEAVL
jgi:hypothetical protein